MAIAQYNSAGGFSNGAGAAASSRTDPITLDGLVNATLITPGGTANPLRSLTRTVAYEPPTRQQIIPGYSLLSGTYNFSGCQLTMNQRYNTSGVAEFGTGSQFELLGQSGQDTIVYVGYDNVEVNGALVPLAENFILNFDDVDQNASNISSAATTPSAAWNTLLSQFAVLDVSPVARWIVNIPTTSSGRGTAISLGGRNIYYIGNSNALTNIRMTINMGRYANDVLVDPDSRLGGPNLANSTQLYDVSSSVPVRDILYRGDYIDWRPLNGSSSWAPLTGGGFIGDHGIKWLIENQSSTVVTDADPLIFGTALQNFTLSIDNDVTPVASNPTRGGDGYFELGLSTDVGNTRVNRIVFINPTGITWQDRLALWNGTGADIARRGRLRVEHQTVKPFRVSDDVETRINSAEIILHHFYPTYGGSSTNFGAAAAANFDRSVTSVATTDTNGVAFLGSDDNTNYATDADGNAIADNNTTLNRPVIVEALELNNSRTGTLVQNDYQAASAGGTSVVYRDYTNNGTATLNAATYDVFAYGHEPLRAQPISFTTSSAMASDPGAVEEVTITRDLNVVAASNAVPARASTTQDIYDILHNWSIQNRQNNPVTADRNTLEFGARRIILSTTAALTVTADAITIPIVAATNSLSVPERANEAGNRFDTLTNTVSTPNRFVSGGVNPVGITIAGPDAPTITTSGFNNDSFVNMLPGRLDVYDVTNGRTPREEFTGDGSNENFQLRVSPLGIRSITVTVNNVTTTLADDAYTLTTDTVTITPAPATGADIAIEYALNPLVTVTGPFTTSVPIIDRTTQVNASRTIVASGGSAVFSGMGGGDSGTIRTLEFVYSRPGYEAEIIPLDVRSRGNLSVAFRETPTAYPDSADLQGYTASPVYTVGDNRITVTIGDGTPTQKTLTASQTNRLLMENLYGSQAFNQYAFTNNSETFAGSLGPTSTWFANGQNFKVTTEGEVYFIGYIDNQAPNPMTDTIGISTTVTDTQGTVIGSTGAIISGSPDTFDITAVAALNTTQTGLLQADLASFRGDPDGTNVNDTSSLRRIRNDVQSARNIILGNI